MCSQSVRVLRGIVPPVITPLLGQEQLDHAGLERVIEHVIAGGVHGLFLLGTTGEGPSLSDRLKRELVSAACRIVNHRVPVLVCITDTCMDQAVDLALHAAEAQADAVVSASPYYFPLSQDELERYMRRLAKAQPLPLVLYNMPAMTKVIMEPATLQHLLDEENIAGIKDSSGDMSYFARVLELAKPRPEWPVFMGPELLLAEAIEGGAAGGVNGGALVEPRLLVDLYEAAVRKDRTQVAVLQERLRMLGELYLIGRSPSCGISALKYALSRMGLCGSLTAEPLMPLCEEERQQVHVILENLS